MAETLDNKSLVMPLKGRGDKILQDNLPSGDEVLVKLQGNFGQALVLTTSHLYIVKWGMQAGQTFGGKCIAYEYRNITAIEIRKHMTTRLVSVLTPATQDNNKLSYWGGSGSSNNAIQSDSAVTYSDKKLDAAFQAAVNLCRQLVTKSHNHGAGGSGQDDSLDKLERLAKLKEKGMITEQEFAAKKKQLLGL
jgi:hypothetical protein